MSTVEARAPAAVTPLNDDIGEEMRLKMYRMQVEIREAEQRAHDLFLQNLVKGTVPPLARPGGGGGRLCRRHEARRPLVLHLPRARPHAGAGRADREGAGRADAARQRPDARQGRLDAPDLRRARRDGQLRHHRRASADRLRRRLARPVQGPQGRDGVLLRRRHHQHRRVPRGAQLRRRLEAAGDLRVREQPLHGVHADRRGDPGGASSRQPRQRLRAGADPRRRAGCGRRLPRGAWRPTTGRGPAAARR